MNTISGIVLENILGWKIKGDFSDIKKSIIIFAPHTSYMDAIIGKLCINKSGIKYKFLSKKELFFFPMNIIMRKFGSIPVGGVKNENAIFRVTDILNNTEKLHIVLSPEGARDKVTHWNKGFYYMAAKANVPIVVVYLDYKKKEAGIKGVINNTDNINTVMQQINEMYKDVSAKYPRKFSTEKLDTYEYKYKQSSNKTIN
ncbi:MAG: 1-acyl-sn-glycerol-3-phosphate acyltransferase [Bacteroidales bacterium]|nr:1-acyl-sn-glycerol-3-phosphate acyltransferase [Bacteroidales bacterium]